MSRKDEAVIAEEEICRLQEELDRIPPPVPFRLLADDITPEKLATEICNQGGRLAIMSAEGEIFYVLAGRYQKGGAPNLNVVLKAHAGDSFRVDRRGRSEHVDQACLTLGLAVQPDVVSGLMSQPTFRGRGFPCPNTVLGPKIAYRRAQDRESEYEPVHPRSIPGEYPPAFGLGQTRH